MVEEDAEEGCEKDMRKDLLGHLELGYRDTRERGVGSVMR